MLQSSRQAGRQVDADQAFLAGKAARVVGCRAKAGVAPRRCLRRASAISVSRLSLQSEYFAPWPGSFYRLISKAPG